MGILTTLTVSIVAGIIAYYICKWLDRDKKDNQPKKD